jgi:hypothetical protein
LYSYAYVGGNPISRVDPLGLDYISMYPMMNTMLNPPQQQPPGPISQTFGAMGDFWRNYNDMRTANTINGDKYFHCKANCEAARRGPSGANAACRISDAREWFDQNIKGDPASASAADQAANAYGRGWGGNTSLPCEVACMPYRPNGLPPQY